MTGAATIQSQDQPDSGRLHSRLVELTVVADPAYGLQVIALPAGGTVAQGTTGTLVWLRFDPDSVLAWLNSAAAVLRTAIAGGPAIAIQWSPPLLPVDRRGGLLLGRQRRRGTLEKARFLAVADSAPGWQAELTGEDADSLLRLFLVLASRARIDTSGAVPRDQSGVDRPAVVEYQPRERGRGSHGTVALQYIVEADGRVNPGSITVLLATSPRLEAPARAVIGASRFSAAQIAGTPVRQLVRQVLIWP